ncbi:MAG: methyltransferase domain-containing protein [Thermoplasmata archaeon]|nr:methyltransferase domain-containing protein [Thermoplasmata archaeon]
MNVDPSKPVERYRLGIELLGATEGVVLDVGCSIGTLERFIPCIGVDVHRQAVGEAKNHCPQRQFILADSEYLPFKSESVDAVIMLDTLEHVGNESKAISEVSRILREDGSLVISVPNKRLIYNLVDLEFWLLPILIRRPRHRHYDVKGIQELMNSHGLQVEISMERGLIFSELLRWSLLPFDVVDYSLFHQIRGPLGGRLRDWIVDRFVDKEFDIPTTCGRTLFVRARKIKDISSSHLE